MKNKNNKSKWVIYKDNYNDKIVTYKCNYRNKINKKIYTPKHLLYIYIYTHL